MISQNINALPPNLEYSLRFPSELRIPGAYYNLTLIFNWHTNLLFPLLSMSGPREAHDNSGGNVFYFHEGFVPIQDAIARSYNG